MMYDRKAYDLSRNALRFVVNYFVKCVILHGKSIGFAMRNEVFDVSRKKISFYDIS